MILALISVQILTAQTVTGNIKDESGAAQVKNQSNLITFNQRYSRMTYNGYHFSQLGTLINLSLNYKF